MMLKKTFKERRHRANQRTPFSILSAGTTTGIFISSHHFRSVSYLIQAFFSTK